VALSGLYLTDTLDSPATRLKFKIPALSFIGTGLYGYERLWADNAAVAGPDHCDFALRAGGESVGISLPDGTLVNGYTFGSQEIGVSEGRLPDGSANIVRFPTTPTPADANYLPLTDIVINEVLTAWSSNSSLEAAIELRNISTWFGPRRGDAASIACARPLTFRQACDLTRFNRSQADKSH